MNPRLVRRLVKVPRFHGQARGVGILMRGAGLSTPFNSTVTMLALGVNKFMGLGVLLGFDGRA